MSTDLRPRVLCVDDDPQLLKSLRWLLARDHDVVLAEGGEEGLRAMATDRFDVIVSDQRMPGMTGTEFLAKARALSPGSVRLLLTGHADFPAVLSSVNECEVFRFIAKPWDSASLLAIVAEAVRAARANQLALSTGEHITVDLEIDAACETVLVFDRDQAVATQVQDALQGTRLVEWRDGIGGAVDVLSSRQVAVLVSDIGDGDLQQMDLIRALRSHQPQVAVVVYSQLRDSATLGQLINEGKIHRYLTKPTAPETLRRTLQSALVRHRDVMRHPDTALQQVAQRLDVPGFERVFADLARRSGAAGAADTASGAPQRSWLRKLLG